MSLCSAENCSSGSATMVSCMQVPTKQENTFIERKKKLGWLQWTESIVFYWLRLAGKKRNLSSFYWALSSQGMRALCPGLSTLLIKAFINFFLQFPQTIFFSGASQVMIAVKNLPAIAGDPRDAGSIPGLERFSGEGNGNPLQYPCLENSMDIGTQWATVHGITENQTWLRNGAHTYFFYHFIKRKVSTLFCVACFFLLITSYSSHSKSFLFFMTLHHPLPLLNLPHPPGLY